MKNILTITFALILTLAFSLTVLADQAAYITEEQAKEAVELLKEKVTIKHYCQPCSDKSIRVEKIDTIVAEPTGYENYWQVKVNGKGIDLAYVYYEKSKGKWKNTAQRLDIKVNDVPRFLEDKD